MGLKFDDKTGALKIPRAAADAAASADSDDLRVLLLLARAEADGGEFDPSAAANELGIAESDVRSSLKFWRGAGVLGRALRKKAISAEAAGAPPRRRTRPIRVRFPSGAPQSIRARSFAVLPAPTRAFAC